MWFCWPLKNGLDSWHLRNSSTALLCQNLSEILSESCLKFKTENWWTKLTHFRIRTLQRALNFFVVTESSESLHRPTAIGVAWRMKNNNKQVARVLEMQSVHWHGYFKIRQCPCDDGFKILKQYNTCNSRLSQSYNKPLTISFDPKLRSKPEPRFWS